MSVPLCASMFCIWKSISEAWRQKKYKYRKALALNLRNEKYTMTLSFITDPFIWAPALLPLIIVLYRTIKNHSQLPYPPGPKGLPILGNVFDLPASDQWVTVQEWGKKYGM